jgi:lipoprotein-releasing system ATP-binding protein
MSKHEMPKQQANGKALDRSPVISASGIWKSFDDGKISVLKNVSFEVTPGEVVALWGVSGSGKSTLLHLLGGLDSADRGTIRVAGMDPASPQDRLGLRREKVGFIFQMHNLLADLTMRENCFIPALATGQPAQATKERFEELTDWLNLDHRRDQRIRQLSGGERQRTAICRALMHRPQVILADEPTGSLDEKNGEQVFQLLYDLSTREGVTVIMATHERHFAERCDRHILVKDGAIVINL